MVRILTSNALRWLRTQFSDTATDIKMNGTQSAGSSNNMARADHVHPTDTSRASSDHVHGSITNDGKVGSAANKPLITGTAGLVGAGAFEDTSSNIQMDGTAGGGSLNTFARGDHVHPTDTSRAPENHASSSNTYGVGSPTNYGHVKVDAAPTSSSTNAVASGGVDSALALKQNEVETQSKVVKFINKDRITLERIMERINNPSLKALFLRPAGSSSSYYVFCDNIKVGKTNANSLELYLDGAKYDAVASSVVLKSADGTVIKSFHDRGSDPAAFGLWIGSSDLPVGIHYLYAEATYSDGSVRKSNILSVFVKENQNLLSYNQWSCGDYNGINGFYNGAELTTKYSILGECSIRAKRTSSLWWSDTVISLPSTGQYTLTCKILNKSGAVASLRLLQNNDIMAELGIPVTDSFQSFSLTGTFTSVSNCRIRLLNYGVDELYIDDVSLTSS